MKMITKLTAIILVVSVAAACSTGGGEKIQTTEASKVENTSFDKIFKVKQEESMLAWEGYKPTGQHHGTVAITQGDLMVKDGKITGGKFVFDMNSITVQDLTDPEWNGKLTGHLKSADFFEVESHPQANFEITEVKSLESASIDPTKENGEIVPTHAITGNLTMKGITKSITFNAKVDKSDNMIMAESNMFFQEIQGGFGRAQERCLHKPDHHNETDSEGHEGGAEHGFDRRGSNEND